MIEDCGGLSHINHPGDWLETNADPSAISKAENVAFFAELLLKYDSCLGIEVFNEKNGTTGYDRILWDNLLMSVLPYGKNVIGFSNTDAHNKTTVDSSFSVFMMEENTSDEIKETMIELGAENSVMTGSGSAVFGIFNSEKSAEKCCENLKKSGLFATISVPTECGIEII